MKALATRSALLIFAAALLTGLKTGDLAPDFSAKNQDGQTIHLADFRGKHPVLLYFYPKDDTSGCTKEAIGIRDQFAKFQELGAVVLGVSGQDEKSHQDFRAKHKLPFDLLVDPDGAINKSYDVGTMFLVGFYKRRSVLIGKDGKIVRYFEDVNPETHATEVLKALKE